MKKGATKVVKNYIKLSRDVFSRVLETEKRFELVQGEALITGVIDLLKKYDEKGNLKEVEVIDFKTEKEATEIYVKDYELQLRLYVIACFESLGLEPKQAVIHHLDSKKGTSTKTQVDISPANLAKARKELNDSITSIINRNCIPNESCRTTDCDWFEICPYVSR